MMSNLVTKTLYQKRKFMIGWSLGLFAMSLFMLLMYPPLHDSDIGQLFQNMSPALQKVAGGQDSFSTIDNYVSSALFGLRMPLLYIVLSIILFNGLTVGDERRGVLMTQLSLPISRTRLLVSKLLAALIIMMVVTAGMLLGVVVGLAMIHDSANVLGVLKHTGGCLLIALDFGLLVFMLGGGFGWKGGATAVATAFAFGSYLISSLAAVATVLQPYEKFSLFHYYQNPTPVSLTHAVLLLFVSFVLAAIGLVAFPRRDVG